MKPVYVYVAGPLSKPNPADNTRKAVLVADELLRAGYTPYVPHLTMFWECIVGPRTWEDWLDFDENWLRRCDVLLRLPGESPGAHREVMFACNHDIPIVYSIDELKARFPLN
jgi:hypothetical protein